MAAKREASDPMGSDAKRIKAPGGGMTSDAIKAMLEKTKRDIEAKKQALLSGLRTAAPASFPTQPSGPPMPPPPTSNGGGGDMSALKASVAARLAAMRSAKQPVAAPGVAGGTGLAGMAPPPLPPPGIYMGAMRAPGMMPPPSMAFASGLMTPNTALASGLMTPNTAARARKEGPQALILDKQGRIVDKSGREVIMVKRQSDFIANKTDSADGTVSVFAPTAAAEPVMVDERLPVHTKTRDSRSFNFIEQGQYVAIASKQRAKAQLEKLQEEIAKASKKTGISSATKLALIAPFKNDTEDLTVPDVEWWDQAILPSGATYEYLDGASATTPLDVLLEQTITRLIQHPIQLKPPAEPAQPAALPVMLTKKERKKMRTQRRKAEEKEKQEKIRLGLMEPPAPKVKKANFMRVLGNEAVSDPTKVENLVKAQMAIRQRDHTEANSVRALTKEERKAKVERKLKEDTSLEVHVAVFRVNDLTDAAKKFKVDINAKQLYLTGVGILHRGFNLVVVEGGPKGIKAYKKLMLRRIKWSNVDEEDDDDDDDDMTGDAKVPNKCVLVWEGSTQKRSFNNFELKVCRTEEFARDHLARYGVPHYWDMALSDHVVGQVE